MKAWLIGVLLLGLIWRLAIINGGFHDDLYSNTAWSEWIYVHGSNGFYDNQVWTYSWPTQPPVISLLYGSNYWLYARIGGRIEDVSRVIKIPALTNFSGWWQDAYYGETPLKVGAMITMKLWPILADLGIAGLLWWVAAKQVKLKRAWGWSLLFLATPFSWYVSSWWGQYDGVGFLVLALAGLAMVNRRLSLGAVLFWLSVGIKPTALVFGPLFGWWYFRAKPNWKTVLISIGLVSGLFWVTTQVFTPRPIWEFVPQELVPKIFFKTDFRLTTNAFNFWRIWTGSVAQSQDWGWLGMPAKYWGYLAFGLANILAFRLSQHLSVKNLFQALLVVGGTSFLLMTNMLDRYFYAAILSLLFLAIFDRRYLAAWIILSLIFWLNLYNQWWYPPQLTMLKAAMLWEGGVLTKILSAVNVLIFGWLIWQLSRDTRIINK